MNEIEYLTIIRKNGYRILHGGRKRGAGDIKQILKDVLLELEVPTNTLAKTEDWLELEYVVQNLLRHFHVLVFWREGEVQEILELSGRGEAGNLLWNRCYTHASGQIGESKWVTSMINQRIMANPDILIDLEEN